MGVKSTTIISLSNVTMLRLLHGRMARLSVCGAINTALAGLTWGCLRAIWKTVRMRLPPLIASCHEEAGSASESWKSLGSYYVDGNRGQARAHIFVAHNCRSVKARPSDDFEAHVGEANTIPMVRTSCCGKRGNAWASNGHPSGDTRPFQVNTISISCQTQPLDVIQVFDL